MGIFFAVFGMLVYLIETGLQLHLCVVLAGSWPGLAGLHLSYMLSSLLLVNIASAVMVLRNMDFSGKRCGRFLCILLHSFQLGLIWRCLKLLILYDESDWKEYLALRLIHTALQSLPFVVTMGYHMFANNWFDSEAICTAFVIFVSGAIALATYNLGKYLFDSDEFLEFKARARKPIGITFLVFGTFLMLISRCVSFILMTSVLEYWIALPIGLHFLVFLTITCVYSCYTDGCTSAILKKISLSYLNVFELVDSELSKVTCRNVFYYSAVVLENTVMTASWMVLYEGDYLFKLCIVALVIVSFIFGVILKSSSCGCIHWEDSDDPISVDTMDLALYITKQANLSRQATITAQHRGDPTSLNHRYHDNNVISQSSIHVEVADMTGYDNEAFQNNSTPKLDELARNDNKKKPKKTKLENDNLNPKSRNKTKQNFNGSNNDVASSNSRNTNTLNISSQSNRQSARYKDNSQSNRNSARYKDNEHGESIEHTARYAGPGVAGLLQSSVNRKRNKNSVRPSGTLSDEGSRKIKVPIKQASIGKSPSSKKKDIPLFPNDCNEIADAKVFGSPKTKHILSNSVEEYDPDDSYTDTSDSEYISYSYYYDTDWSTMLSFDSEDAAAWSQHPVSFVNLHSLPKEKFSATKSVQIWLNRLEEWKPFLEHPDMSVEELPDVLDKTSKHFRDANTSSHHSDSSYRNSSTYTSTNYSPRDNLKVQSKFNDNRRSTDPRAITVSNTLPNKQETSMTFCAPRAEHDDGHLEHVVPQTQRNNDMHMLNDNSVVLWQQEEITSPDFVQESMV